MKKITVLVILALALLSSLYACGGTASPPTDASTTQQPSTVTMGATTFDNNTITIPKGGTITFITNQGGTAHNLINGSDGKAHPEAGTPDFGSGGQTLPPGKSWTSGPWNTAGTYHVTCTYHPTTMTMTVTVTG